MVDSPRQDRSAKAGSRLAVGELFAKRYEIEAQVGRGGMGSVYRVHDREVDDTVALKTLDNYEGEAKAIERFRREVRLARRVTHRNAARTFDLGVHEGVHFLTMEFVDGRSLRSWMGDPHGAGQVVDIALQIAAGLDAAHEAGVVHRDLKPSNILIDDEGRAVITDFGIASMNHEQTAARTNGLLGTPAYMAPEQVEGQACTPRSDIYSLGLILFQMLTGELPFRGDNAIALAMARLQHEVELGEDARIPEALVQPLERCLARDPNRRWASVGELARELGRVQGELETISEAGLLIGADAAAELPTQTAVGTALTGVASSLSSPHITPSMTSGPSRRAKALAVLPFRYRGPADSDYLADALLDELTDLLSMTRGLKVTGTGATAGIAASDRDPRRVGAELGVDVVVDGTIQLAGGRLRISARLLDVEGGFQQWSGRFDGELADVFELQDKLCKRVAEALRVELEVFSHRDLADVEAVESYLRARQAKLRWELSGPHGAVAHYRRVLERAPEFKPAIAGLAIACVRAWFMPGEAEGDETDWGPIAVEAVEQAMREAPNFAETRMAAASFASQSGDYRAAATHLREALRIAPTCALAHEYLGRLQLEAAQTERGLAHAELAHELDPALGWCLADIARYRALRGDLDGYEELMARVLRRAEHYHGPAQLLEMRVGAWTRDVDKIRRAMEALDPNAADPGTRAMRSYGPPLLAAYDAEALAEQHRQLQAMTQNGRLSTLMFQLAAEQTAFHGDHERALDHLEAAAKLVLVDLEWLEHCPLFDELREDPRYREVRATVRARCEMIWAAGE